MPTRPTLYRDFMLQTRYCNVIPSLPQIWMVEPRMKVYQANVALAVAGVGAWEVVFAWHAAS